MRPRQQIGDHGGVDAETIIQTVLRELIVKDGFRLPIHVATLAANGTSLITKVEEPPLGSAPGSVAMTHVTGEVSDEGFLAPLYILLTDATGRAKVAHARGDAPPRILEFKD